MVERLLDAGADVYATAYDLDALEVASYGGHLATVELLLQRCPPTERCEPLELLKAIAAACRAGHVNVLRRLLAEVPRRAVTGTDEDVNEDLVAASSGGHVAVVDILVGEHGADVAWRDDQALTLASKHGHAAVVTGRRAPGGGTRQRSSAPPRPRRPPTASHAVVCVRGR